MAENCRATKDESFYSWPQYTFIREGCLQDQTALYNYDPSRAYQRFQIKTFRFFNDYGNVYLHCELIACHRYTSNSRCNQGCLSSASARRKRREVPSNQRGNEQIESTPKAILSGGPVIIKDVRKSKDPKQINHENFIAVVAAVSGFALIAVIALSVLFVKYRIARLLMNRNKVGDTCATQDNGARTKNECVQDQDVIELEDYM